jgi:hypothetical protein
VAYWAQHAFLFVAFGALVFVLFAFGGAGLSELVWGQARNRRVVHSGDAGLRAQKPAARLCGGCDSEGCAAGRMDAAERKQNKSCGFFRVCQASDFL